VQATIENEAALAQLDNVIRATGEGAGFTTQQLAALSTEMARSSTLASAAVQGGLARLLAYTNIQGDAFTRAAQATLDMSAALRIDMTSAAETLGRALDDPINGLGALSRQGFKFSAEQKALIQSFMDVNDVAGAQGVILESIESVYDGAALAARNTLGGALTALKNEWADQIVLTSETSQALVDFINYIVTALPIARDVFVRFTNDMRRLWFFLRRVAIEFEYEWTRQVVQGFKEVDMEAQELRRSLQLAFLDFDIRDFEERVAAGMEAASRSVGRTAGHTRDLTLEINAAIAATQSLIAGLEKERDALQYSRWELIEKSKEYRDATETQQKYIRTLFDEGEMLREQARIRDEDTKAKEAAEAARRREIENRENTVARSIAQLQREAETLEMTERQIFKTSDAYSFATSEQRKEMLAIFDLIEARKQSIDAREEEAKEIERIAAKLKARQEQFGEDMRDAFQPFFEGMILGLAGMSVGLDDFKESIANVSSVIIEAMTEGLAEEQMAMGMRALATGTWPPNPAAIAAAGMHFAAAGAFRALPGAVRRSGQARPASMPAMGATDRPSAVRDRQPPEINIYIDPLDPSNPAYQSNLAQALGGVRQRYGSATVNVRPRT